MCDLAKRYGEVEALSGIGFDVGAGEVFGLLGPNGAGKTTTVEAIAGLVMPDRGAITIRGIDAAARPREAKQRLGVVLQRSGLPAHITPREAARSFAGFYDAPASFEMLLDRFGLCEVANRPVDGLSGGQRQRLSLALAFTGRPEVLILDEPTAGLDPAIRRELHYHIRTVAADGVAVLITTHDMAEAEALCDRVAVIAGGRIVAEDAPAALIARARGDVRVEVQASAAPEGGWPRDLPSTGPITDDGDAARFATGDPNRAVAAVVAFLDSRGLSIVSLRAGSASLEEVILDLTGR